jgi:DNA transformation protein
MPEPKDQDFLEFVVDQLQGLRGVSSRPMFGCIGLYSGDDFFAIIDQGRLYFCTDATTRGDYRAAE